MDLVEFGAALIRWFVQVFTRRVLVGLKTEHVLVHRPATAVINILKSKHSVSPDRKLTLEYLKSEESLIK